MKLSNYQKFHDFHDVHEICRMYSIKNYTINSDGSVDVNGDVNLFSKKISVLPLRFHHISGSFDCGLNDLKTLKGSPIRVDGSFSCNYNHLTSLEGGPEYVGGDFKCNNNFLTSLEGGPKNVVGSLAFYAHYNKLRDFHGFPEFYEGYALFSGNPVYVILRPIPKEKECQFIHLVNEFDVIRDGKTIIKDRLEEAYYGIGMELPENITIKGYEII